MYKILIVDLTFREEKENPSQLESYANALQMRRSSIIICINASSYIAN